VVNAGSSLCQSSSLPAPVMPQATSDEMKLAAEAEAQRNANNLQSVSLYTTTTTTIK